MQHALSDLVVVELDGDILGAYAAKLLADFGADVVKVEHPGGLGLRDRLALGADGTRSGVSGTHLHVDTNKRSIVVDPGTSDDRDVLWALIDRADLLIESSGWGTLEAYGLDWNEVHARVPEVVLTTITGFGADGPYARYASSDLVAQAFAGMLTMLDGRPLKLPAELASCIVATAAAVGSLGAVSLANATGTGSHVDCAAYETLVTTPSRATSLLAYFYRDGASPPAVDVSRGSLIPSGVFPCADGWVSLYTTPQRINRMLATLDDDGLRAVFADPDVLTKGETREAVDAVFFPWLLSHSVAEVIAEAQRHGWSSAPFNSPAAVVAADHLHQRGFWTHADHPTSGAIDLPGPPFRLSEGGWALRRLPPSLSQHTDEVAAALGIPAPPRRAVGQPRRFPLEGIRVVDLTTVYAGPYATMLLADLGAEVIRVENPWVFPTSTKGMQPRPSTSQVGVLGVLQAGYGPAVADRPDRPYNRHAMNNSVTRNKLSCSIDIRRPEGLELLLRLVERSDVLIENFKPTSLPSLGLHPTELLVRNPRLVLVRMPATGLSGDWSTWMGFGPQFDALTGVLWLCGHLGSDPMERPPATTYMDAASGPGAAFATLAALRHREHTGRGQVVEFPQIENMINLIGDVMVDLQLSGVDPPCLGNRDPWQAPQGVYPCAGGRWIALSVEDDGQWAAVCEVMGRADLVERYPHRDERLAAHDELDKLLQAWTADKDVLEVFHHFQAAGVPAAPLMDDAMLTSDAHVLARDWLRPLTSADVGTHRHPGHLFAGVPQAWTRGSPVLGQDNEYVFKELLGVSDAQFDEFRRTKLLAEDYFDASGAPL